MSGAVVDEVVLQVARMLDVMGVAHAFMGGLALNAWGIPRATFDIDFVVAVRDDDFATFVHALAARGVDADEPYLRGYRDTLAGMEKIAASLQAAGHWYRLDIFRANTPFLESVVQRRVATQVRDAVVYVVSAADLVLFKLIAGRRKDWVDIDNIVAVQGVPEPGYLETWARLLGVEDRLRRILAAPG